MSHAERKNLIDKEQELSVAGQCELLLVSRSNYYYQPVAVPTEDLAVMRLFVELWAKSLGLRLAWDRLEPGQSCSGYC